MEAEIISVGAGLLLGQITDTNRPYIARALHDMGIDSHHQSIVGDNEKSIHAALNLSVSRAKLIIMIGGLGPTTDDLTKQVVSQSINQPLIPDSYTLSKLKKWHDDVGIEMADNNYRQALFLKDAVPLKNDFGFAVGSFYQNTIGPDFLLLPGPPWEMEPMFDQYVLPLFTKTYCNGQALSSLVMRYFGIGESRLSQLINGLIVNQTNPTIKTYAQKHEVVIRLKATSSSENKANNLNKKMATQINQLVGDYFYGVGEHSTLEKVVAQLLQEEEKTIAMTEVFTRGLVQSTLQNVVSNTELVTGGFNGMSALLDLTDDEIELSGDNGAELVKRLAELTQKRLGANIGLAILAEKPESIGHQEYVNEKVWFGLFDNQQQLMVTSQIFAKDHQDNIEEAIFVALDLVRRHLIHQDLVERA
ncbi:CinA family nicotinamide mononucleotide deamidase-related protein [Leuconostoc gasicomitatum]|uniref:CinA family nicotinamide mononucleotide deamidase-related protein n=1 Tax=Leuconostoc gasicomitatum TaxID=115778 RepID=UPI000BD45CF0|nr:CinA family nicotinamide mononucleotide deamidase-related protein [Leuconostoc gasicomitatum]MBZ5943897.1 CinA family nicotinamide mononucleotide deamidase-related protein [Leuconostoc gasicomitatum]MBZ5949283.1 CinA family nicotinamide mononucleotide deamidase-related protein [Leuconostoc gasicomitatum]MBZ5951230.1 CinA family nicotinamide mononucleotide deamidase-related protein [Leuconostoc gasicomitatum]MBZ5967296.1 CinA family nicotinamide mononucleotide deamidase-related protein [Leuco